MSNIVNNINTVNISNDTSMTTTTTATTSTPLEDFIACQGRTLEAPAPSISLREEKSGLNLPLSTLDSNSDTRINGVHQQDNVGDSSVISLHKELDDASSSVTGEAIPQITQMMSLSNNSCTSDTPQCHNIQNKPVQSAQYQAPVVNHNSSSVNTAQKKGFKCLKCGKSFTRKTSLERHDRAHTGEKPFTCDVCGKQFSQKAVLHRHTVIHSIMKPYQCDLCQKTFSEKTAWRRHYETHSQLSLIHI